MIDRHKLDDSNFNPIQMRIGLRGDRLKRHIMSLTLPSPQKLWTDMIITTLNPHPLFYIIIYIYTRIIDNQFVVNKVHLIV